MKIEIVIIIGIVAAGAGVLIGTLLRSKIGSSKIANAEKTAADIVDNANREAESLRKEADIQAKDTVFKAKSAWEDEVREARREMQSQEKRLQQSATGRDTDDCDSDRVIDIDKLVAEPEFVGQIVSYRLHAVTLGRVMPGGKKV